jgi:hypothetical protein
LGATVGIIEVEGDVVGLSDTLMDGTSVIISVGYIII